MISLRECLIWLLAATGCKEPARRALYAFRMRGIARVRPTVERAIPHDQGAYTQGLCFHNGMLIESTGLQTESSLRCIDPKTGKILRKIDRPGIWAEGVTVCGDRVVQLSWHDERAHVFRYPDLAPQGELTYSGEGWGLTSHGTQFIMSNGGPTIAYRDADFSLIRTVAVTANKRPLTLINDLEFARGHIFANVLHDWRIYEIAADTGRVLRIIDCEELYRESWGGHGEHVLNGIAYDASADLFFLTGKRWNKVYVVRIPEA